MVDENILLREGLFNRTFSVLEKISYENNSTKLADTNSVGTASSKTLTERKEAVPAWNCVAGYSDDTKEAGKDEAVRHSEYCERTLD